MPFDPDTCCRRSIRLKGYDYSQPGSYFVTVCTHARECLLGEIFDGEMTPNEAGRIVRTVWEELPDHYACVVLDGFVIMPNHVHGIVAITDDVDARADGQVVPGADRAGLKPAPTIGAHAPTHADNGADSWRTGLKPAPAGNKRHGLPEIVRAFKTFTSRRINESRGTRVCRFGNATSTSTSSVTIRP